MHIAGFNPNSFVDYPDNISAVVFIGGCNMNCWYCHNKSILNISDFYEKAEITEKIFKRRDFLDAVVITGGEPTLENEEELTEFIKLIKSYNLKVKLDTNGTNHEMLKRLLPLLDYVAMDIKAPLEKYNIISIIDEEKINSIKNSISLLIKSNKDYEFRTTFAPNLSQQDILEIAELIKGCKKYYLQQYVPIDDNEKLRAHPPSLITDTVEKVKQKVPCIARGI